MDFRVSLRPEDRPVEDGLFDLLRVVGGHARSSSGVDIGLLGPAAERVVLTPTGVPIRATA